MFKSLIFIFHICISDISLPLGFYCIQLMESPLIFYKTMEECNINANEKVIIINEMLKKNNKKAIHFKYVCLDTKHYENS